MFAWQVVAVSGPLLQLRTFLPELPGDHQWIELPVLPPLPLISDCVVLMMMDSAQRHGEFVANFEPHSSRLREAHMVRMRGLAPTDRAGLPGNVLQMLLRPDPLYFRDGERALVNFDTWLCPSPVGFSGRLYLWLRDKGDGARFQMSHEALRHILTGNLKGRYAVTVTRNWRITFAWEDGDAVQVNFEDYHSK